MNVFFRGFAEFKVDSMVLLIYIFNILKNRHLKGRLFAHCSIIMDVNIAKHRTDFSIK